MSASTKSYYNISECNVRYSWLQETTLIHPQWPPERLGEGSIHVVVFPVFSMIRVKGKGRTCSDVVADRFLTSPDNVPSY